jgi:Cu/Ag efflux protein CusF
MYYKFEAEHISRGTAVKFVRELEAEDIDVDHADVGRVFENQMTMVVTVDNQAEAEAIRARIWEINHGAYCDMAVITADQLEEYL